MTFFKNVTNHKKQKYPAPSNIFTSKSNVLQYLQNKLNSSIIEPFYFFDVNKWNKKKNDILKTIFQQFDSSVVVRSSAMGEDSHETSQAGVYESILNVDPKNFVTLTSAINKVIKSYEKKGNFDKNNQILIHKQSNDIQTSGVLFSRTADTGSPYFVINFEEGENTTGVTQGLIGNNIKIFRDTQISNIPKKWKSLIKSIKEIEEILKIDSLDIEFGIKKNNDI